MRSLISFWTPSLSSSCTLIPRAALSNKEAPLSIGVRVRLVSGCRHHRNRSDDEPSMAVELLSFSQGADDYLVYAPLDPLVILATPGPEAAAAAARGQTGAQAAPWQALLGLDEEEEPALAEALEVLNRQLQALARDI